MKIFIDYKTIKKIGQQLKKEIMDADKSAGSFRQSLKSKAAAQYLKDKYKGVFVLEDVERLQSTKHCKEVEENGKALEVYSNWCKWNK